MKTRPQWKEGISKRDLYCIGGFLISIEKAFPNFKIENKNKNFVYVQSDEWDNPYTVPKRELGAFLFGLYIGRGW